MFNPGLFLLALFLLRSHYSRAYSAAPIRVFPTGVAFTPLVCRALVPARRDNTITNESDIVTESLLLA